MSLTVRFLGTSASRPTVERNVSSVAVIREGETLMFDCGEGTQRQMMRYGISFALSDIFFTHMHADHMLGLTGLLRTLGLVKIKHFSQPNLLAGTELVPEFFQEAASAVQPAASEACCSSRT